MTARRALVYRGSGLVGELVDGDTLVGAASAGFNGLNRLSTYPTKCVSRVAQDLPAGGTSATLATFTGAGTIVMAQVTIGGTGQTMVRDGILEFFVDGETLPAISCDVATMLLTGLDAMTIGGTAGNAGGFSGGTEHMITSIANDTTGDCAGYHTFSGGIAFPIPFSSGCIVKLRAPTGVDTTSGLTGAYYSQIIWHPGATSPYRLRSKAITQRNKQSFGATEQIAFIDRPNGKGSLVWLSICASGGSKPNYGYLERQEWFAVDSEDTTPDSMGVINSSFVTSGGEDLFLNGYYFAGLMRIKNPWVVVSSANNDGGNVVAGIDLLGLYGGIPFANRVQAGWSLKEDVGGYAALKPLNLSYCLLYYVDTSTPFVPSAVTNPSATTSTGAATVSWAEPSSCGSVGLTGYRVTLSPGGASQTVAANVLSAAFSGLTNGTAYTASIVAINAVGDSAAATTTFTPSTATVSTAPTGVIASTFDGYAAVQFVAPSSNGGAAITGYTATASPGGATGSITGATPDIIFVLGLTNGTSYTFTVVAHNAAGDSAASTASSAHTPNVAVSDNFNRADASTLGTATTGQTWQYSTQNGGTPNPHITGNTATIGTLGAQDTGCYAWIDVGKADMDVTVTLDSFGAYQNYAGGIARIVDGVDNLHYQLNSNNGSTGYTVERLYGGGAANGTIAGIAVTPSPGDTLRMRCITLRGTTTTRVDAWVNGSHQGQWDVSGLSTSTYAGFQCVNLSGSGGDSTVRFNNFVAS